MASTTEVSENLAPESATGDAPNFKKPRVQSSNGEGVLEKEVLKFRKISPDARTPTYGSKWSAGADIYCSQDCVIPAKGKGCVHTGLQLAIPQGFYGRVAPRSNLAVKKFIDVGAGVIDSDYRGELSVVLFNFGDEDLQVKKGDRIAQLICEKIAHCEFIEAETLDDTERGEGGFGSTGV